MVGLTGWTVIVGWAASRPTNKMKHVTTNGLIDWICMELSCFSRHLGPGEWLSLLRLHSLTSQGPERRNPKVVAHLQSPGMEAKDNDLRNMEKYGLAFSDDTLSPNGFLPPTQWTAGGGERTGTGFGADNEVLSGLLAFSFRPRDSAMPGL